MKYFIYLVCAVLAVGSVSAQPNKQNYRYENGKKLVDWSKISNVNQYTGFSEHDKKKISENGFVIMPANYHAMEVIYDLNNYNQAPSFITTDLVLQSFSTLYDDLLSSIEYYSLSQKLRAMDSMLFNYFVQLKKTNKNPAFVEPITKNCAFFALGLQLLKAPPANTQEFTASISAEMQRIAKRSSTEKSDLCGSKIDYTQFIPRGHYTYNNLLRNFFRSMMWLQLAEFDLKSDCGIVQAALISYALNSGELPEAKEYWSSIYGVTNLFVGESDGLSPDNVYSAMITISGAKPTLQLIAEKKKMNMLRNELFKIFKIKSKISASQDIASTELKCSVMGQRYVPDAEITQKLTRYKNRDFPRGLDVPAALGSAKAKTILFDLYKEPIKWPDYEKILAKLTKEFGQINEKKWTSNLYHYWLYCLKSVIEKDAKATYPFFMNNTAWDTKSLNTFTGSWAELRHNTALYAMQSAAEAGDGDDERPEIEYPRCYLEPNTTFYKRMIGMIGMANDQLAKLNVLNQSQLESMNNFDGMVRFLDTVNNKELEGLPITKREHEEMRMIGGWVEKIAFLSGGLPVESEVTRDGEEPEMLMKESHKGVVVDIHNSMGTCLEVGVGSANEIYVAVEIEGKLRLLRGAVFSYYEFTKPTTERLDDTKWHQMIYDKALPEMPEWTKEFLSDGSVLVEQRQIEEYIRAEPTLKHRKPKRQD